MAEYEPGIYHFEVSDVGFDQSKNGNPQIIIRGKVTAYIDESDPDRTPCAVHKSFERTIKLTVSTTNEDSKKYTLMKLKEAGFDGDDFGELPGQLRGKTIEASCGHEEGKDQYAGKTFERWDLPLPVRESTPIENKPSVAMTLNNLFGAELKKPKAKKPAKQAVKETTPPSDDGDPGYIPDDEVPF